MPVLNINEDEKTILVTALTHERVRLMAEWTKRAEDCESSAFCREADCAEIDAHADDVTDLRRKIEVAEYAPEAKTAWHHERGWLTKSFFESDRGKAAYEAALQAVEDNVTGPGLTPDEARKRSQGEFVEVVEVDVVEVEAENLREQDQIAPGKWTTLPEGFDVDADPGYSLVGDVEEYAQDSNPFEITDADEPVTAGIDTQARGDGKVRIDIKIGGRTLTVDGSADLIKTLGDLNRRF